MKRESTAEQTRRSASVLSFVRKKGSQSAKQSGKMVRVINPASPFFTWEGLVRQQLRIEGKSFVQIECVHHGFVFPVLTFSIKDVREVANGSNDEKSAG